MPFSIFDISLQVVFGVWFFFFAIDFANPVRLTIGNNLWSGYCVMIGLLCKESRS